MWHEQRTWGASGRQQLRQSNLLQIQVPLVPDEAPSMINMAPSLCLCSSCPHKNSAFSSVERLVTYKMSPFTQQPLTVGKLIPFCLKAIPVSALNNYYMGSCLVTPVSQVLFREATSLRFMSESRHQERLKIIAKYVCLPC